MEKNQQLQDMIDALLAQAMGVAPNYDKKGNVKPYSLQYQKDAANYQQDAVDLTSDPLSIMFSGQGSFDPQAFAPTQVDKQQFDLPSDPLAAYMQLADTSVEGKVARSVAAGKSPDEIAALAQAGGLTDKKAIDRIRNLASDLFTKSWDYNNTMASIPDMAQTPDGQWSYQGSGTIAGNKLTVPVMGDSKASKTFKDRGLPLPTDQFTQTDFGYGPDRQAVAGARSQALAQMRTQLQGAEKGYTSAHADALAQAQAQLDQFSPQSQASQVAQSVSVGPYGQVIVSPTAAISATAGTFDEALKHAFAVNGVTSQMRMANDMRHGAKIESQASRDAMRTRNGLSDTYKAALSDARKARSGDVRDQAYAEQLANLHQQYGLTPLTMVAMQRMKARG